MWPMRAYETLVPGISRPPYVLVLVQNAPNQHSEAGLSEPHSLSCRCQSSLLIGCEHPVSLRAVSAGTQGEGK